MQSFSEAALGFEPGPGQLGVVLAQAGVGKTAFLVHLGIDQALAGDHVLHVAVGSRVDHVQSWYDALWRERFPEAGEEERSDIHRRCIIQCLSPGVSLRAERIEEWVQLYQDHSHLHPRVILIDGFDWEGPLVPQAAQLGALRSLARSRSAFLWLSAPTHQPVARAGANLLPPVAAYESVIDHAAALVSQRDQVLVRRLRAFGASPADPGDVPFSPESLGLSHPEAVPERPPLPREAYTLLSGGAAGAETLFGECAEAWHLSEIHFSFAGRRVHRHRGLVELTQKELEQGDVSLSYVEQQLGRRFPRTRQFHTLLQTIWHQVATAREVFIVGLLLPDGTVNGGTGWAAELGKHLGKQIHVFDQESKRWFRWTEDTWAVEGPPRITHTRFTGTGTRYLSDSGRKAIVELFERSFGPKPD
jgi:hypothetical protein